MLPGITISAGIGGMVRPGIRRRARVGTDLEIDALDLDVQIRGFEFRRQGHHRRGDLLVQHRRLLQLRFDFRLRNQLRGVLELRGDDREADRDRLAIEDEGDVELDGAEVRVVNRDAFLLDFVERQRPGRDARNQDLVEDVDRHAGGHAFHARLAGQRVHQRDAVQLVVADHRDGRQQERRVRRADEPLRRGKAGAAEDRLDVGAGSQLRARRAIRRAGREDGHEHGPGNVLGNRHHRGTHLQERAADVVVERGQRRDRAGRRWRAGEDQRQNHGQTTPVDRRESRVSSRRAEPLQRSVFKPE